MSRSQAAGDGSRVVFKVEKPHFFKIILEITLHEKRLRIPNKFLRLHGHTLSESVLLKLPCGSVWRIGLEKRDGGVWLRHGWLRFAESYSIVRGHMLVFEYQGNSEFSLVIFNDTTCEIDYPLVAANRGDVDIDIEGDRQVPEEGESLRRRERSTKTRDGKTGGGKFRAIRCGKADILQLAKPLGPSEVNQALARVSGFASNKPFFKVVMQPSYVLCSRMSIPSRFAKAHLKQRSCNASLEVSGERSWPLKYSSGVFKTNQKYATARFFSGWRAFAQDNSLDIGDACVFVLTKNSDKKIAFQVTIFKSSNQNANPS